MGGMGFIEKNKAACMLSVLINTNLLRASRLNAVKRYLFTSSACVYNAKKQKKTNILGLKESDVTLPTQRTVMDGKNYLVKECA